ncbi:MAG: glycosyltransferase family 4 protein [Gemmatimonadota bacterium]
MKLDRVGRLVRGGGLALASRMTPRGRKLYIVGDGSGWALDEEARHLHALAVAMGIDAKLQLEPGVSWIGGQRIHFTDQFVLESLTPAMLSRNSCAVSYLHGTPDNDESFRNLWSALKRKSGALWRIHVSCRAMESRMIDAGIDASKVHRIPLGVDPDAFPPVTPALRAAARRALGIPGSAVVIGSFQKDGHGWGEGNEPKLIKGPDILVEVCARLRGKLSEAVVLLSGAARGFVRRELTRRNVPLVYTWAAAGELARLYHASDLVLVTSRDEGGPKAVLESMACGVPLVSTAVGQAADIVEHGTNGWLASVGDVDALTSLATLAIEDSRSERVTAAAMETARANSYTALAPRWQAFFE